MTTADLFHRMAPYGGDGATFSPCGRYRYRLWRVWGNSERRCCFMGINPSFGDATVNDHSITKSIGFAQRWGFGAIDWVNLYAWRSTDQRGLLHAIDPAGPENRRIVGEAFDGASRIVLCWGSGKTMAIRRLIDAQASSMAPEWLQRPASRHVGWLGLTDDGYPRHPLMLPYATPFVEAS